MNLRSATIVGGLAVSLLSLTTACGTQAANAAAANTSSATNSSQSNGTGNFSGGKGNYAHRGFGMGMMNSADVAKLLGITPITLQSDLKNNQSIAQIAQSKGISESKLISELETDFKTQMDSQVKSGKIQSSQEQQMISRYDANIKTMVDRQGPPQRPNHAGGFGNQTTSNQSSTN
jgi:hypothetical protein